MMNILNEVTVYFITTERVHAPQSMRSLTQQQLIHPIQEVRNVSPLSAAYAVSMNCTTAFTFVVDDDVVLHPNILSQLMVEFQEKRIKHPNCFWLHPIIIDEISGEAKGGAKLFYTPLLKQIGFPNSTHVSFAQREKAEKMGLCYLKSNIEVGFHKAGTLLDTYKRYLWLRVRNNTGMGKSIDVKALQTKAEKLDSLLHWVAYFGWLEGKHIQGIKSSKEEALMGAKGAMINFETINIPFVKQLIQQLENNEHPLS